MLLTEHSFSIAIPMFLDLTVLLYVCQRFAAARSTRRKIIAETREFATIVNRARDSLSYIGERVAKGMDEIKEDVGQELRITDRLTTQSAKLAMVLGRFASLEENVIELVRMDRDRESVRIETPTNVANEIERIVRAATAAAAARRKGNGKRSGRTVSTIEEDHAFALPRNPLSKFSASTPRETVGSAAVVARTRIATTPEVRLLGEANVGLSK